MLKKVWAVLIVVLTVGAMAVPALSASAEASAVYGGTIVVTETQVNSSYRVTSPARRQISNMVVDLQPGQAVITLTWTTRGRDSSAIPVSTTWTPVVSNGRLSWTLASATSNGAPISNELRAQINAALSTSWRNYWRSQHPGRLTTVEVTASELRLTWA
ncbi:MAG: hypothetical protein KME04_12570 [Pleurocapsa minor GSE-CHR-MK-17-07R]|jgi:hypothetical protein|nr:hypothetical protein [Pleurocapsa minor GSE-CHR-MK 17-07R]